MLLVVGIAFSAITYFKTVRPVNIWLKNATPAQGIIITGKTSSGYVTDGSATVRYRVNSEYCESSASQKGRITRLREGEQVNVYYAKKDPRDLKLAETHVLYNETVIMCLFTFPILLFGFMVIALAVMKRESFFDISAMLKDGIPPKTLLSLKILPGILALLWILKITADIPVRYHTWPYNFLVLAVMFVLNIASFLILLHIEKKDTD